VVTGRIALVIPPNPYNEFYLKTKAEKSGHFLDANRMLHLQEQGDRLVVEGMSEQQVAELQQD
jgi:GTP cyclohydrolase II